MSSPLHPAQQQAADATRLPAWFWLAAPVIFVATVALSAVWPWGFA